MIRKTVSLIALGACFSLLACNSGPSKPGTSAGKDEAARLERKVEFIEGLLARRGRAAEALQALTAALPDRAWLTEVGYDSGKIKVKGRAATNNLLADYITRLGENPSFTNMTLGGSVMKNVGGRETQEFTLEIALLAPEPEAAPAADAPPRALEDLEETLAARQDSGARLRAFQGLARDAGLQMTKFVTGTEMSREFAAELPVTVEVAGGLRPVVRYLESLAELPGLWLVDRFTLRAAAPDDPRAEVRASFAVRAYYSR